MQLIAAHLPTITPPSQFRGGGRVGSDALRHSYELSAEFAGLEADTNRYDLLLLVKRAGQSAGFSSRMIQLLDYYMAFTRDADWEEGARPIVYQSLAKTSLDLGVSERQVQRLEQGLFALGAITWNDAGNHRRYGQRCPKSGRILYAFGVELTPLAALRGELAEKLAAKEAHDRSWMETKRQISWYRRQICAGLAEAEEGGRAERVAASAARYQTLALPIRTYMRLDVLRALLAEHKALHGEIIATLPTVVAGKSFRMSDQMSSTRDIAVVHYNSTTQESSNELESRPRASCFQESVTDPARVAPASRQRVPEGKEKAGGGSEGHEPGLIAATGLQHVSLKQALNAASERFRARLPLHTRGLAWGDMVEAAYRLRPELKISQSTWAEACGALGRNGAAVCLLLTDQAALRDADPVRKPGAYFRAMIHRAESGELRLHRSVFAILKREDQTGDGVATTTSWLSPSREPA